MCGRYTLKTPLQVVIDAFSPLMTLFPPDRWVTRFNIAPSQPIAGIRLNSKGERVMDFMRWGLIPSWSKGEPKLQPINVRSETAATSRMFGKAMERRRCLIPADGFYEWQKLDPKTKQPMYVHRRDGGVFAFAGVWERWKPSEEAAPIDTCAILTTSPNDLMSPIHDRMPVIVQPKDFERWLDREVPATEVQDVLTPAPAEQMEAFPVSKTVNSPRNEEPGCIEPLTKE